MKGMLQRFMCRLALVAPGGCGLRPHLQRWRGVQIGRRVWISLMVYLDELYPEAISIGENSTIGMRSSVFTHLHWGARRTSGGYKCVAIGPNVFVGPHSVILPGVHIGEGAVIKAGSVVSRNVPARVFWGGSEGQPLAAITVPLTPDGSYDEFIRGLKPIRLGPAPTPPARGAASSV